MKVVRLMVVTLAAATSACASIPKPAGPDDVNTAVRERSGASLKPGSDNTPSLPSGITLDDGLTRDEAVAIALWNNPAFAASLADLGIARADLADARLLRNPILSLLFPVGPKQLEWTLSIPVDVLWQRPRRVAAAASNTQAVAERLVSGALTLIADVRQAFVDVDAAERRVALAAENAALVKRIADITDARLRAGDISELEARVARSDASQVEAAFRSLEHDRDAAKVTLIARLGYEIAPADLRLAATPSPASNACGPEAALLEDALASRPDVRAAEIAIEAAAHRARWEQSRIVNLVAMLDANGSGSQGYEMGPGLSGEIPIFSRNQGAISRAQAELERASRMYLAVRFQVTAEIRTAMVRLRQAEQAAGIWGRDIVPSLETEQRQAEAAYRAGEAALLLVLDTGRRLVQGRMRQLDAGADVQKAAVLLDRSVGRSCAGS
jgi:cobalt-zinc-cadmium efflux system outer membrane protein